MKNNKAPGEDQIVIFDHLQTLKTLSEKCIEYNKPLTLTFIEFKNTVDTKELPVVLKALEQNQLNYGYVNLMKQ